MAFISYTEHRGEGRKSSGIEVMPPFVRFRKGKGSVVSASLNKAVPLRGKRVDIQIDKEARRIRIGERKDGLLVDLRGGRFSCGKAIFAEVGDRRIWLTQGEDGWWYGSYAEDE